MYNSHATALSLYDLSDVNPAKLHMTVPTGFRRPSKGATLFREESAPWVLKGGYALELRFKAARSAVGVHLTVERVPALCASVSNQIVRDLAANRRGDASRRLVRVHVRTACFGFDCCTPRWRPLSR